MGINCDGKVRRWELTQLKFQQEANKIHSVFIFLLLLLFWLELQVFKKKMIALPHFLSIAPTACLLTFTFHWQLAEKTAFASQGLFLNPEMGSGH